MYYFLLCIWRMLLRITNWCLVPPGSTFLVRVLLVGIKFLCVRTLLFKATQNPSCLYHADLSMIKDPPPGLHEYP